MQQGREGMGSHKHGISGRAGPRPALKQYLAKLFNEENARSAKKSGKMYSTVREAFQRLSK